MQSIKGILEELLVGKQQSGTIGAILSQVEKQKIDQAHSAIIDAVMECVPKEKTEDDLRDITLAEILSFNQALAEMRERIKEI